LSEDEKEKLSNIVEEKIKWLESNQNAEVDDFKAQKKEVEDVANPIITKFYQNSGAGGAGPEGGSDSGAGEEKDEL